jgi:hypothetical protein
MSYQNSASPPLSPVSISSQTTSPASISSQSISPQSIPFGLYFQRTSDPFTPEHLLPLHLGFDENDIRSLHKRLRQRLVDVVEEMGDGSQYATPQEVEARYTKARKEIIRISEATRTTEFPSIGINQQSAPFGYQHGYVSSYTNIPLIRQPTISPKATNVREIQNHQES